MLAASILVTLVLGALLVGCGGGTSAKLYGSSNGMRIGGLLASYLGKQGHTGIKSVGCQKGILGYRCQVVSDSAFLVCDAFGSGFSELGTSKLTDASCDTRSHYRRVLAQTVRLARRAIYLLNQDTQLTDVMAAYQSEGAKIACTVGRQQEGKGLSTNIGFYLVVATPSLPQPPPADVIVTPQGVVTVEHPKANKSDAGVAGCSFDGNSFSISSAFRPTMLVADTIHAQVIPAAEISNAPAPPATPGSTQSSTPVGRHTALTAHEVETTLHSAVPSSSGRAAEVSCDDIGTVPAVSTTTVFACTYITDTGTDEYGCFTSASGAASDLQDVTDAGKRAGLDCKSYFLVGPGSKRCGNVQGGHDLVTSSGSCSAASPLVAQATAACAGSDSCSFGQGGFCTKSVVPPLNYTKYVCVAPGINFYFRLGGRQPSGARPQVSTTTKRSLPKLINAGSSSAIRPATFHYSGDASEMLGGLDGGYHNGAIDFGHLTWTRWTRAEADATGADWGDSCNPNCAQGKFSPSPATVRLFAPASGYFTRLTVRETQHGKSVTLQFYAQAEPGTHPTSYQWAVCGSGSTACPRLRP